MTTITRKSHEKWQNGTSTGTDTRGANFIPVHMNWYNPNGEDTISDDQGNGAPIQLTASSSSDPRSRQSYWKAPTVAAVHKIITTGTGAYGMMMASYANLDATTPLDQEATPVTGSLVTSLQTGSLNSANADSLFLASIGLQFGVTAPAINSPFTDLDSQAYSPNYGGAMSEYIESGDSGAQAPTYNWSAAGNPAAHLSVWKLAGGGGSPPPTHSYGFIL